MSTYNVPFYDEVRKISMLSLKKSPYLDYESKSSGLSGVFERYYDIEGIGFI